ncbi:MAG: caspase family protein [Pseudomonadota bacterium]
MRKSRLSQGLVSILALYLLTGISGLAVAEEAPRYALVIGNSDYRHTPLKNPLNDAVDVAEVLRDLNYDVTLATNLDPKRLARAVAKFYRAIESENAISIFYYAGHAVQVDSTNYLLPVGVEFDSVDTLESESLSLDKLLFLIRESPSQQNIIVLDACRDNPFGDLSSSDLADLAGGLASASSPPNTLIAYATEPGSVSSDGSGRNGLYTGAILKYIEEAIPAEDLFKKVRRDVLAASGNRQVPWEHSSLTHTFYFGPPLNTKIKDIVSF